VEAIGRGAGIAVGHRVAVYFVLDMLLFFAGREKMDRCHRSVALRTTGIFSIDLGCNKRVVKFV
jgi:hypothetical protein